MQLTAEDFEQQLSCQMEETLLAQEKAASPQLFITSSGQ